MEIFFAAVVLGAWFTVLAHFKDVIDKERHEARLSKLGAILKELEKLNGTEEV